MHALGMHKTLDNKLEIMRALMHALGTHYCTPRARINARSGRALMHAHGRALIHAQGVH